MDPRLSLMRGARVMVVGDVLLDRYWYGATRRISPEAPVPVVLVDAIEERVGGAANVAANAAALDATVLLLGIAGEDADGERLKALCREAAVEPIFAARAGGRGNNAELLMRAALPDLATARADLRGADRAAPGRPPGAAAEVGA